MMGVDQEKTAEVGLEMLIGMCHRDSIERGWWSDLKTGEPLPLTPERVFSKMMLIVSEVSEAAEGYRKNLADDHLLHRPSVEVELADAVIRICDLAGALHLDLSGAVIEKMRFNRQREDHNIGARLADGGKKI